MSRAFVLGVDHAAQALGIPRETLVEKLDSGELPEAISRQGKWMLRTDVLATIAEREQWPLAKASVEPALIEIPEPPIAGPPVPDDQQPPVHQANHSTSDPVPPHTTSSAKASLGLANPKEVQSQMTDLVSPTTPTEVELARLSTELGEADHRLALTERDRAIANARVEELRRQIEHERLERSALISKIRTLEADQQYAVQAMSRRSKRRYLKRRSEARKKSSLPPSPAPRLHPVANRATETKSAITASNAALHSIPTASTT